MSPLSLTARIRSAFFETRALNPQPLPPRSAAFVKPDPIGPRALNPQPLPPKAVLFRKPDPIGPRALNPQPLPPRADLAIRPRFFATGEIPTSIAYELTEAMAAANRAESLAARVSSVRPSAMSKV